LLRLARPEAQQVIRRSMAPRYAPASTIPS